MAPTLHVWASGAQHDGAFGWAGAATKDITNVSKKHEASAQKELAKLRQVGTKVLRIEKSDSTNGANIANTQGVSVATSFGIGLGVVTLLVFRQCVEMR